MKNANYSVSDDSGFLALVDPLAYSSFIAADWTFDQLIAHFKSEANKKRLVIWGTGREDVWNVDIKFQRSATVGFREFSTVIRASGDHLLVTNYEDLTTAAQFEDEKLPQPHNKDLLFPVLPGIYRCRVIQRLDPESDDDSTRDQLADFIIELAPANEDNETDETIGIPWTDF